MRHQSWIESLWPLLIVLVLTAIPYVIFWRVGPLESLMRWEPGFQPWVWIPLALSSSFSFGLAHAALRNDPEVRECRYWEPKESIWHGVGHAIVVIGAGIWMIGEGYPPISASLLSGLVLYVAGEGMSIIKDYMKVSF